jgi:cell wall-associated NlpC family hydrolase
LSSLRSRTIRNRKLTQINLTNAGPAAVNAASSGTTTTVLTALNGPSAAAPAAAARLRAAPVRVILAALAAVLITLALAPVVGASPASASVVPRRMIALTWAKHQAGKWYCYGGTGPGCFDCSGLVMRAYAHAGIALPRTTYGMLASPHLVRIPASARRRGDLAFYGPGHVELVTLGGRTFGAAAPGTRIWWHIPSVWWHPTMYFRVR